ncbi:hypothetical protein [Clostridium muellerianum]|uniref:hyaluronate lyase N-terminal domain-containing protein n=1 Tax=Clostridium muellerianum TaxID=2716538 RepID=UPI0019814409|nr:hypothetical protein [Clostridium muellerianum]
MSQIIKIKRGLKKDLTILQEGEMGFCTDKKEFYIGNGTENTLINKDVNIKVENSIISNDNPNNVIELVAGNNINITPDETNNKITISLKNNVETKEESQAKANTAESNAKIYADNKVASIVNSAPTTLDTLQELAKALGDDPNFATTITNMVASKETPQGAQQKANIAEGNAKAYADSIKPTTLPANGGNANTLDGKHVNDFAPSGYGLGTMATNISSMDLNNYKITGFFRGSNVINAPNTGWFWFIIIGHDTGWTNQIAISYGANNIGNIMYSRIYQNASSWTGWNRIAKTTDIPTKLSQFANDIGAGSGVKITTSVNSPSAINAGDFWYKII